MDGMESESKIMTWSGKYDQWLMGQLKNTQFATEYLNAAAEDEDIRSYIVALRNVVEARGGISEVAEKTSLSKETLYRTLSARGNPTIKTLSAILHATGLKMTVAAYQAH
jgi:probable addiction module antidote protein